MVRRGGLYTPAADEVFALVMIRQRRCRQGHSVDKTLDALFPISQPLSAASAMTADMRLRIDRLSAVGGQG